MSSAEKTRDSIGEGMWPKETEALLVGMWIGAAATENNTEAPQKIKNRVTLWSSNPTSGDTPKGDEITVLKSYLHLHVIAALSTIANIWKQLKCPLMNARI